MLGLYSIVFNFGVPRFQPELSNSLKWTNITNGRHLDWENFDRLWGYRSYASGWSFPPGNRGEVLRQSRREKKSNVMLKVKAEWLWTLSYLPGDHSGIPWKIMDFHGIFPWGEYGWTLFWGICCDLLDTLVGSFMLCMFNPDFGRCNRYPESGLGICSQHKLTPGWSIDSFPDSQW